MNTILSYTGPDRSTEQMLKSLVSKLPGFKYCKHHPGVFKTVAIDFGTQWAAEKDAPSENQKMMIVNNQTAQRIPESIIEDWEQSGPLLRHSAA